MIIKVGDYVETCRLVPGILIGMSVSRINFDISEIDIYDKSAKIIDCKIFYEDYARKSSTYNGSSCALKACGVHSISKERYNYLNLLGEDLLKILWKYYNRCCEVFTWKEFTELYYNDPIKLMRYIPIKNVLNTNTVEFGDGSIWQCQKIKYNPAHRKQSREKKKKHHIYLPMIQLYGHKTYLND
jgi:hypothetical protein